MATFNGTDWTFDDFSGADGYAYAENWDPFWTDVIAEMDARRNDLGTSLVGTSSTNSVAIGTGTKTLTVASPSTKGFAAGMYVVAVDGANSANAITGRVTSYSTTTGALDISVPTGGTTGSGTPSSWVIGISGATGPTGDTGPTTTYWGGTAGGTANALTATTGASLSSLTAGQIVDMKIGASANSGAATLNVDAVGAKAIQKNGAALVAGDLPANTTVSFMYDGTAFQLVGGAGGSGLFAGVSSKSSGYTVVAADSKYLIECTAGLTLGLTAAATLGSGFTFVVWNHSTGTVIVDPNGSELINGSTTLTLLAGQWAFVTCTGTAWKALTQTSQSTCVWSSTDKESSLIVTNSGLTASVASGGAMQSGRATVALSGQKYFEVAVDVAAASGLTAIVGMATAAATFGTTFGLATSAGGYGFASDSGNKLNNSSQSAYGSSFNTAGTVVGVAYDDVSTPGTVKIWLAINGVWQASGNPATGANPAFSVSSSVFYPAITCKNGGQVTARFTAASWSYSAPAGFTQIS